MSDGKVHLKSSIILAAGFGVGALILQDTRLLECTVGALVGTMVTPDLDLSNGGIVGGRFLRKKVGWFGERLWRFFWKGYSTSAKHGSWLSHFPIFSTFIRLSYIFFWAVFVPHSLIYLSFSPAWNFQYVLVWYAKYLFSPWLFIGLCSSDLIHWALDNATTEHKHS